MYGSAPAGSVLTSLLTPAENLYGSRYSNTSTTHDAISDAMRSGAVAPNTTGKLPMQRTSVTGNRQSGVGRQQILLSDEDDTVYPISGSLPNHLSNGHLMSNSNYNSPSRGDAGYDLNQSINSADGNSYYMGGGERDVRLSSDYFVGSHEDGTGGVGFESPTPAALQAGFNEAEMHQQFASKVLNANTNRVLSQYYQQQYEEQQMKLKLQQEQKEKQEKEAQEKAALSAAKKKHHHTNTGSRSRSSSSNHTPSKK